MNAPSGRWPLPRLRPLPRKRPPVSDETVASYVSRLAAVNHLEIDDLRRHLDPERSATTKSVRVSVEALSTASGSSETAIAHALPELHKGYRGRDKRTFIGRTLAGHPNTIRPACRHCMTSKAITAPVMVWMRHDHNVCLRHGLWIGPGANVPTDQADLTAAPEIMEAQRLHNALIRCQGRRAVHDGFQHARRIVDMWHQRGEHGQERDRRYADLRGQPTLRISLALAQTVQYPEVIALTKIFTTLSWQDASSPYDLTEELVEQIRTHVVPGYNPSGASEPLLSWLHYQQPHLAAYGKSPFETFRC